MRDETIEQWLTGLAVEWEYVEELDPWTIDVKASMRNQARLEPIADDVVERYAEDMKRGDRFPAILLRRKGEKLITLGGNHRQTAARKVDVKLSAYVFHCAEEVALRISYEDNRRHGLPSSQTERLQQARHLIAMGINQREAARIVGVTESMLSRALAVARFEDRCRSVGIIPAELKESAKSRLMNIRSDPAFAAAVRLTDDAGLGTQDVYELASAINAARSDDQALEHIRNEASIHMERIQRRAAGVTGRAEQPARARLLRACAALCVIDPNEVILTTLPDQRRTVLAQLRKTMEHLAVIDTGVRR